MMATVLLDGGQGQKLGGLLLLVISLVSEETAGPVVEPCLIQMSNNHETWIILTNLTSWTWKMEKGMYQGEASEVNWVIETKSRRSLQWKMKQIQGRSLHWRMKLNPERSLHWGMQLISERSLHWGIKPIPGRSLH